MTEYILLFIGLFLAHWVGDFLLQTEDEAINKSHQESKLLTHVAKYGVALLVFATLANLFFPSTVWVSWVLLNIVVHHAQDRITSRMNADFKARKREDLFWNNIGFDQMLHMILLVTTMLLFL